MAREKSKMWVVGHDDFPDAYVEADCFEEATVEAAKVWRTPWAKVASGCCVRRTLPLLRNVCAKCGRFINSKERLCRLCQTAEEEVLLRLKESRRKYYQTVYGDWK